ncbi:unnamed protein product [Rotaria sordida]|uniref:Uncharacterized protein n=1 Tax=Rotaria sordida TaxID=392033 RepID=A0A815FTM4_9BILA|nr:unnamed protein product [Rotaria sordida]CAF1324452.1 unnamed protein product [Rotaria sordida]CAF3994259.1 unnamed protein product [Rotaria sordida]
MFEAFDDINTCIDYMTDAVQYKICLIITEGDAELIIPVLVDFIQIDSIFILCLDESTTDRSIENYPKVKGVFNNIRVIIQYIEETHCDTSSTIGFDVVGKSIALLPGDPTQANKQEVMFMYGQLIKEILTRLPYSKIDIDHMFEYFFVKYINESSRIEKFVEFERDYRQNTPVWWYTKDFLYSILNTALRTHNISMLYPMRVFIRDLHQQLIQLHSNLLNTGIMKLYRGQLIPIEEFEKIRKNPGGLLSINSFLSTSRNKDLAEIFAGISNNDPNMTSVLLEITVDTSVPTTTPFASIGALSNFGEGEDEYLFTMDSVFRINSIEKCNANIDWCVRLTLTNDNDPDLFRLTNSIRSLVITKDISHGDICSLAMLMMIMDETELAIEILETVLNEQIDPVERFKIYVSLGTLYTALKDSQQALLNYKKAVNSYVLRFLPMNVLADIYYGLSELCMLQKKFQLALINVEIALGVELLRCPKPYGERLAHIYHVIGRIYENLDKKNESLTYYQLAIKYATKHFPRHHPFIAICMMSQAALLYRENQLGQVVSNIQESGRILANSLSTQHELQTYVHMTDAQNFCEKHDWNNALASYQKALRLSHLQVSSSHTSNCPILCGMASVYTRLGRYNEALSTLQQSLEILTTANLMICPHLTLTYSLIGEVFEAQRDPSALSYYRQAWDIGLKCLPPTDLIMVQLRQALSRLQH